MRKSRFTDEQIVAKRKTLNDCQLKTGPKEGLPSIPRGTPLLPLQTSDAGCDTFYRLRGASL